MFVTVEQWEGQDAADVHMTTPHVQAALAAAGSLLGAAPSIQSYTPVV